MISIETFNIGNCNKAVVYVYSFYIINEAGRSTLEATTSDKNIKMYCAPYEDLVLIYNELIECVKRGDKFASIPNICKKIKNGIKGHYLHYKGGTVNVIGECLHSETLEALIIYEALYDCRTGGYGSLWVRPKDMFFGVTQDYGQTVARFKKI